MQTFTGKVISIKKDKNYANKLFAKVNTKPNAMYFIVTKKMNVQKGDIVTIEKEEGDMKYLKIIINGKPY